MKRNVLGALGLMASLTFPNAQSTAPAPLPPPPPVYPTVATAATQAPVYIYDQKPISIGRTYLIAPEQAQSIINRFKEAYQEMGAPRVVVAVNRDLVDETAGMKLTSHKRVVETTRISNGTEPVAGVNQAANGQNASGRTDRVASTNIYRVRDAKEVPLADKQTMRDVERLFGRPLRMAGVHLADQRIASQLLGGKALDGFDIQPGSDQGRKDREALTNIADVVLEILVSSKDTTVSELSGARTYATPDIQATAIRLSDSKILGQATAADLIGQGPSAGRAMRTFGIREIAEATALSLMEDMMGP